MWKSPQEYFDILRNKRSRHDVNIIRWQKVKIHCTAAVQLFQINKLTRRSLTWVPRRSRA